VTRRGGRLAKENGLGQYTLEVRIKPSAPIGAERAILRAGEVWRATDTSTSPPRSVILKHTGSRQIYAAIIVKLRDFDACNTNNIVPMLDYLTDNDDVVEVMPNYSQGTLQGVLSKMRKADLGHRIKVATTVLRDISKALEWLHKDNGLTIVHNDIKPDNIFIKGSRYYLGDFDNSLIHAPNRAGGNPDRAAALYAPPERFSRGFTAKGDYWSLGLVLMEVVLGQHPLVLGLADQPHLRDTADLIDYWQSGIPGFLSLPRDWQALFFGLTALREADRWDEAKIRRWQSNDDAVRTSVVNEGLELGKSALRAALAPYKIGAAFVTLLEPAAQEILRCDPAPDVLEPEKLAAWVEDNFNISGTAGQIRQTTSIQDLDLRRLTIALLLDKNCKIVWRGIAVSGALIAGFAANNAEQQASWIESLRVSDPLLTYAKFGNEEAQKLRAAIEQSVENLNLAWREMQESGCMIAQFDEASIWRTACQTAFSPGLKAYYLERLKHLSGAASLFSRPAWISRWSGSLSDLSVEQLHVIDFAEAALPAQFDRLIAVKSDAIPLVEGSDEVLEAQPIIWLSTQERLLGRMRVSDIARPHNVKGGEFYPESAAFLPEYQRRSWVRKTLYPQIRRWFRYNPFAKFRRLGSVGDAYNSSPELNLAATIFETQADIAGVKGPTTFACELRWRVPEGYNVQIVIGQAGVFHDSLSWKTPLQSWLGRLRDTIIQPDANNAPVASGLSRIGRMALSVCQTSIITLVARPRVRMLFPPTIKSEPIIIVLPDPVLRLENPSKFIRPEVRLEKVKTRLLWQKAGLQWPRVKLMWPKLKIEKPSWVLGALKGQSASVFYSQLKLEPVDPMPVFMRRGYRIRRAISRFLLKFNSKRGT
jgi:serine/threonine protein kinase